jgi:TonB family protein
MAVSEKPLLIYHPAFIVSAIVICCMALMFPLTVRGRDLAKSTVDLSATMPTNHFSSYAKSTEATAQRQMDPESAPLETADPDPIASILGQPETTASPDAVVGPRISSPETDLLLARHASPSTEKEETVGLAEPTSGRFEGETDSVEQTFKVEPEQPALQQAELLPQGVAAATRSIRPAEMVSPLLAKPRLKPGALRSRNKLPAMIAKVRSTNASAYGARVWAALARHKPKSVQHGSTTVAFEIGASGALGYVRVDQSSGNAKLDQMALRTICNAAPFPPPPNGAAPYTIRIDFQ